MPSARTRCGWTEGLYDQRLYYGDNLDVLRDSIASDSVELIYLFPRIHQTLRCTPAMAAGVTKTLWDLADMVEVLENWEASKAE